MNMEVINHTPDNTFLGNNKFVSGVVSASAKVSDGYVLVHDLSTDKWSAADATSIASGKPLGVIALREDLASGEHAGQRICIAGDVNKNLVSVAGDAITGVQAEYLRVQGIYVLDAKQIGVKDNQ